MRKSQLFLGLDLGGTKLKSLLLEAPDTILYTHETYSKASQSKEEVQIEIQKNINFYKENFDFATIKGIGIGCAGSVDPHHGIVRSSPNFSDFCSVPLKDWIFSYTKKNVHVENDANAAAYSEFKMGHAQGYSQALILTFGTGIGGGVILNGNLYRGATGSGGELGHMSIDRNGPLCSCGHRGCFEMYASATALKKMTGLKHCLSKVFEDDTYSLARTTFLENLKIGLTSLCNIFDPQCLVVGGGLSKSLEPYFSDIHEYIKTHAFKSIGENITIRKAKFDIFSGALGSALLARDFFCPSHAETIG